MLIDQFGRHIDYLRVSLTDRCNFRCTYCMPEDMQFAPKRENLEAAEMELICRAFVELGIKKIRLTGGEPLVYPEFGPLLLAISQFNGLERIAITTNGALLAEKIDWIRQSKVRQLNISLDSVDPDVFARITRVGKLDVVLEGIDAAIAAGVERIRLNAVVSKGYNDDRVVELVDFAIAKGIHIAFIEEMPLGDMQGYRRADHFVSNESVREQLARHYRLEKKNSKPGQSGPADYFSVPGHRTEVGFISPHSNKFCDACNRVRLTRKGELVLCLGDDSAVDLRALVRTSKNPVEELKKTIQAALSVKPEAHSFDAKGDNWQVVRFMNVTGG